MSNPAYKHQKKVRRLLQNGKNVILQAPTGAGKTRAAIEPFLNSRDREKYHGGGYLPSKMIYSVPMRVLARQFHAEYEKIIATFNTKRKLELRESIQTGDMPEDRELTKDLIFATIDQTLSSFLMSPYGLSRGRANLNLGAVLSSYLVFDEFHLYSPDSTLPTVLQMLRLLNGITPFVLMTATFSDALIHRLAEQLNAEVVGLSAEDRESFATLSSQDKTRRYHANEQPLTPQRVLDKHKKRSIVICNTVQRARTMYQQLKTQTDDIEIDVILLHSRFLKADRDCIEDKIRLRFGKDDSGGSLIVVATQAIEVGVDITSTVMHTELAPANAIIQRAGRCARYKDNEGDVHIYRYVLDSDGETVDLTENPLPYGGRLEKPQMGRTFDAFMAVNGDALDFEGEQVIIDAVHSEADTDILNDLNADSAGHRQSMFAAMNGDSDKVGDLVRKVIAQPVTIHDAPESLEKPYQMPAFNLHPGTLRGCIDDWLMQYHNIMDDDAVPPFAVKYLVSETDPDNSQKILYKWENVGWNTEKERAAHIPYGTLLVVHPDFAAYNPVEGFMPETGGGWHQALALPDDEKKEWGGYPYKLETYAEHIRLVKKAAFKSKPAIDHIAYWHELEWAAHKLAERLNLTYEQIREAAELTILLHDVGKLSRGWQGWVRRYQAAIGKKYDPTEAFAHTDYDPKKEAHRVADRKAGKRPPHAVESAVASTFTIGMQPEVLREAIFTAISRHHGAFTSNYTPMQLEKFAAEKVRETVDFDVPQLVDKRIPGINPEDMLSRVADSTVDAFFVYALFARLLRRADNQGTKWGAKFNGGSV